MEIKRISLGQMPPANKYVLIYLSSRYWSDSDDEYGKCWKVAKCVYGISKAKREELSKSNSVLDQLRARRIEYGDEDGNNIKPYRFKEFGHDGCFGQEVDVWCELPVIEEKEHEEAENENLRDF